MGGEEWEILSAPRSCERAKRCSPKLTARARRPTPRQPHRIASGSIAAPGVSLRGGRSLCARLSRRRSGRRRDLLIIRPCFAHKSFLFSVSFPSLAMPRAVQLGATQRTAEGSRPVRDSETEAADFGFPTFGPSPARVRGERGCGAARHAAAGKRRSARV